MASILTSKAKIKLAKLFLAEFATSASKNMYLFIGKSDPWTSDISPDTTTDALSEQIKRWYDMLSLKKISESNVTHAIPRRDWDATGNTKYIAYSHTDAELFDHPTTAETAAAALDGTYSAGSFYCITDEFNVYLCISNNGGIKSTTKPTGRATTIITLADGYRWKYLYTVSPAETLKYVTPSWIPVKTLISDDTSNQWLVQQAAVNGAVDHIKVLAGGSAYTNVLTSHTLVSGTISSGVFQGSASAVNSAYNGCMIFIESGTGAGQYGTITAYTGATRTYTLSANMAVAPDATSIVSVYPKITITGDGTGLIGKAIVSGGAITRVDIVAAGTGYKTATATIGGGGGTGASVQPIISPLGGHGKDPVDQLGAYYTMINSRLDYAEDDFPSANDYRRIGIVQNVKNSSDSLIATAATRTALKTLNLTGVSGIFSTDETIQSNGAATPQAKFLEFVSTGVGTGTLKYFNNDTTNYSAFAPTEVITGLTSGATATIASITDREILLFEGEVLYIENRRPIMRSADQIEDIKLLIEH